MFLAAVLVFSVSYYFLVSLPAHNKAVLQFEREKYEAAADFPNFQSGVGAEGTHFP